MQPSVSAARRQDRFIVWRPLNLYRHSAGMLSHWLNTTYYLSIYLCRSVLVYTHVLSQTHYARHSTYTILNIHTSLPGKSRLCEIQRNAVSVSDFGDPIMQQSKQCTAAQATYY